MPSQWAIEVIQKIKLTCGEGTAGNHKECLRELEKIVLEIDKKIEVEGLVPNEVEGIGHSQTE